MAVVNTKSTAITNADASGARTFTQSFLEKAPVYFSTGTVEVAAADDDTSTFRFCRLPSGAKVIKIEVYNDAITAGTSYDVGLYRTAADGGAVVDADYFASAVDLSSAHTAALDVTYEAQNIDKVEKRLYENLPSPLTADPFYMYDVVATANTIGSAAGTITVQVFWTE